MNIKDIETKNDKLQEVAIRISEMFGDLDLLPFTTLLIRSLKKINDAFYALITAKSEAQFTKLMSKIEDEMDEILYALDKIAIINLVSKHKIINDMVKYGYDLMSIYSMACDKIIEKRVAEEEF